MGTATKQSVEPLCELVRIDFSELPGMRLTLAQACRLWSLDPPTCRRVVFSLVESGYLVRTADDQYCRADYIDGAASID